MFDVGFSEIVVIAVVALIVIGPERLPKVARTLGHLFGRMQRYVNDVKADISREMELDELRKLQATVQDAAQAIQQTVNKEITSTESELKGIATAAAEAVQPPPAAPVVAPPEANAPAQSGDKVEPTPAAPAADTGSQGQLDLDAGTPPARKQA